MGRTGQRGSNTHIPPGVLRRMEDNEYCYGVNSRAGIGYPTYEQSCAGLAIAGPTLVPGMLVNVFDDLQEHVAEGTVSTLKIGDMLSGARLLPSEVGILVTVVYEPSTLVIEAFMETLGDCLHCTIRWPRHLVRETTRDAQDNVADSAASPMFHSFEVTPIFYSSEETTSTSIPQKHPSSSTRRVSQPDEDSCSAVGSSNNSAMPNFQPTQPQHLYRMSQCNPVERGARKTQREPGNNKVTLESVHEAVKRSKCARRCLFKISECAILSYRYYAWQSSSSSERRDWIMDRLSEARVRPTSVRSPFAMKIDGVSICNKCYADAVGYSISKLGALKRSLILHKDVYMTRRSLYVGQ